MKVSKILKFVSLIIALVAVYFFVQVSTNGDGIEGDVEALNSAVGGYINFTKVLLYLIALILIVFMVMDIIKHPSKLKKMIIGVVAFAILFAIALALSKSDRIETSTEVFEAGSKLTKNVGTGIWLSFILGIIAFGGFVFDSVKSLFK